MLGISLCSLWSGGCVVWITRQSSTRGDSVNSSEHRMRKVVEEDDDRGKGTMRRTNKCGIGSCKNNNNNSEED